MTERVFSRKCPKCRQRAVALAPVPYRIQISYDGNKYDVTFDSIELPKCGNCGEITIDAFAEKEIYDRFRRQEGLLTPDEIRRGRDRLGMTQQQFADLLAVAPSTVSRWETGTQVQQRSFDRMMRGVFDDPATRACFERQARGLPAAPPQGPTLAPSATSAV